MVLSSELLYPAARATPSARDRSTRDEDLSRGLGGVVTGVHRTVRVWLLPIDTTRTDLRVRPKDDAAAPISASESM